MADESIRINDDAQRWWMRETDAMSSAWSGQGMLAGTALALAHVGNIKIACVSCVAGSNGYF